MTELGKVYVHFEYSWGSEDELADFASRAFDFAEEAALEFLFQFQPVVVELTLVEGSGKLTARFRSAGATAAKVLIAYGGLRAGIDYAAKDINGAGSRVIESVVEHLDLRPGDIKSSRRDATLARKLRAITRELERGQITRDSADRLIKKAFGEAELPRDQEHAIRHELEQIAIRVPAIKPRLEQAEISEVLRPILDPEIVDQPPTLPRETPMPARRIEVVREGPDRTKRVKRLRP